MAKGTECKVRDCSHNQNNECNIDSKCEPLLDWMSFTGYCPDYDGDKFPGLRDEIRKGKQILK